MNTSELLGAGLVLCAITFLGAGEPADAPSASQLQTPHIRYEHADLRSIQIKNGKLTYMWHTLKEQMHAVRQSSESYDRHEATITLAPSDWNLINKWMAEHSVWSLKAPNCDTGRKTYGSAFTSSLTIELGEKRSGADWHNDCDTGEAGRAASAFIEMCTEIVRRKLS